MDRRKKKPGFLKSIKIYHRYFKASNFYKFVLNIVLKLFAVIAVIVLIYCAFIYFFNINLVDSFNTLTSYVPDYVVWIIFFLSESTLGMIPPDLFMIWGTKFGHTFWIITLLAAISYIGGFVGYLTGALIIKNKRISAYLQNKYKRIIEFLNRWGGFFVFITAFFPFPYAVATMMAGMAQYRFGRVALFGLARFARFYLYALVIFEFV